MALDRDVASIAVDSQFKSVLLSIIRNMGKNQIDLPDFLVEFEDLLHSNDDNNNNISMEGSKLYAIAEQSYQMIYALQVDLSKGQHRLFLEMITAIADKLNNPRVGELLLESYLLYAQKLAKSTTSSDHLILNEFEKLTVDQLLIVASCYVVALHIAQKFNKNDSRISIIQQHITDIEHMVEKKLKLNTNNISSSDAETLSNIKENDALISWEYKKILKDMREAFFSDFSPENIREAQMQISGNYKSMVNSLMTQSIASLGPPPFGDFCLVALGSISQNCAQPYSDLEFLLVTRDIDPKLANGGAAYLDSLAKLLNIKIIPIGETRDANLPYVLPGGFHLDKGTPLQGNSQNINGWRKSVKKLTSDCISHQYDTLISSLYCSAHLYGDEQLFNDFKKVIKDEFNAQLNKDIDMNKIIAIEQIGYNLHFYKTSAQYAQDANDIKNGYSNPVVYILNGLCIYNNISLTSPYDAIEQLVEAKILSPELGEHLDLYLRDVNYLRARLQRDKQEQNDNISEFAPRNGEDERLITRINEMKSTTIAELVNYFDKVVNPENVGHNQWSNAIEHLDALKNLTLNDLKKGPSQRIETPLTSMSQRASSFIGSLWKKPSPDSSKPMTNSNANITSKGRASIINIKDTNDNTKRSPK